jgi:hypothetical protein
MSALDTLAASLVTLALQAAEGAEAVGSGRIQGGWEFVWAGYLLTWAGLMGYGLSLWLRLRRAQGPTV